MSELVGCPESRVCGQTSNRQAATVGGKQFDALVECQLGPEYLIRLSGGRFELPTGKQANRQAAIEIWEKRICRKQKIAEAFKAHFGILH